MSSPYNLTKVRGIDHPTALQMSCIGTPARKALETPSGMSLDSHWRGELRGLIGSVDSINNPPTEGLLCSRQTPLRGTVATSNWSALIHMAASVDVGGQRRPAVRLAVVPRRNTRPY